MTSNFLSPYASAYDLLNCDKPYAEEVEFVQNLHTFHCQSAQSLSRVLDLGCGSGLHLSMLSDSVYKTGIDVSQSMLQLASARNIERSELICSKISDFRSQHKFDLIYSLFHVINYQTSTQDLLGTFETVSCNLKSNGLAVFDFWHRAAWDHDPPTVRMTSKENELMQVKRISRPTVDYATGLVSIDMDIFVREVNAPEKNYVHFAERHYMRAYTFQELEFAASLCGLRVVSAGPWMTTERTLSSNDWYGWIALQKLAP